MNVDEEMLSRLEALAIEAGEAIMKIYAEDFTPEYKDAVSYTHLTLPTTLVV